MQLLSWWRCRWWSRTARIWWKDIHESGCRWKWLKVRFDQLNINWFPSRTSQMGVIRVMASVDGSDWRSDLISGFSEIDWPQHRSTKHGYQRWIRSVKARYWGMVILKFRWKQYVDWQKILGIWNPKKLWITYPYGCHSFLILND